MNGRYEVDNKRDVSTYKILSELPQYVQEWHMVLIASKKTSSTRKDYVYKIKYFLDSISSDTKNIKPDEINTTSVLKFYNSSQRKVDSNGNMVKTSDSYMATIWSVLDNFLEFMVKRKYISDNCMQLIDKPKVNDLDRINQNRILLTKEDFNNIKNTVIDGAGTKRARSIQEMYKERDLAIITLFMTTGVRCTALTEINIEDIDFDKKELTVIDKREKYHIYPLSDYTVEILNKWINKRNSLLTENETNALFVTKNGRIHPNSIAKLVKKYSEEAIGIGVSPHKLRSGFVSILYEETHDVEFCRRAVGHSNVSTTQRYIVTENKEKQRANQMISDFIR